MGAAGRQRVLDHFSWHAVAKATAEAYVDAVDGFDTGVVTTRRTRAHR
jgi:hypothetical protein